MPGSGELFDDLLSPQLESGLRFSNDEFTKFSRPVVEAQQFANVVRANASYGRRIGTALMRTSPRQ
jgi:hypothetical protein